VSDAWLLPEYVEDVLPPQAVRLESLRRGMLDLFRSRGYALVVPPLVEHLDSLLTGVGSDLDLKTFKLVDQLSGRLLGVRADIAPQVARIDAHLMNHEGVTRLCYAGEVLTTLPLAMTHSREQLQVGAELYGHAGVEADVEIIGLAVAALGLAGLEGVRLDVGHVGAFTELSRLAGFDTRTHGAVFRALQAKDLPELKALVRSAPPLVAAALVALPELYGDAGILDEARSVLPASAGVSAVLDALAVLARDLGTLGIPVGFDLAEVRGAGYHSGVVFAAYAHGYSAAVALGGRYDNVGAAFGRARPATGFSLDLREIVAGLSSAEAADAVFAPRDGGAGLKEKVAALRGAGQAVVVCLPGETPPVGSLRLASRGNGWEIE
jgi:ATP phosphoribosyltransferase regulatory subunit